MFGLFSRALRGERGVSYQFYSCLILMVIGIFVFLSNTACGETSDSGSGSGGGCGSPSPNPDPPPPENMDGSQETSVTTIEPPAHSAFMVFPIALNNSHATSVTRTLGYSGSGVIKLIWTPPPGASNFNFSGAPTPEAGGPPFVFLSPPASFTVSYDLPELPPGVYQQKLSETLMSVGADYSASYASLVNTIQSTVTSAVESTPLSSTQHAPALPQAISVFTVDEYRSVVNDVITTTQCQNIYNWLQGDSSFAALRVPVTASAPNASFPLPVIYGTNEGTHPVLQFTINSMPVIGIVDVPLEILPERATYLENNLPAATGEHWLALGVAANPKITCPSGLNNTGWEFHFSFPIDLVGKATNLPIYYCYEGEDAPPVSAMAAKIMAGANSPSIQAEGITCVGPQDHSLVESPALHIGNPGVAWNIVPPESVPFLHILEESTLTPVNLSAISNLTGSSWTFYKGDDSAPDMGQPITNPWTPSSTFDVFWLVGEVPEGADAGSYNITVTAAKDGTPSVNAQVNDILWVGEWVPPSGQNSDSTIYLPLLIR